MKLLFDENLSHRLAQRLGDLYPESGHVRDVGLRGATDEAIWEYAQANGFTIVSKDSDFYQRAILHGPPPQVVWLRLGNGPTADAERLMRDHRALLQRFATTPEVGLLPLPE